MNVSQPGVAFAVNDLPLPMREWVSTDLAEYLISGRRGPWW